jgi:hypothetical protein
VNVYSYLRRAKFECRMIYQLSWLWYFVIFLSPSRPGGCLDKAMTASFYVRFHSPLISNPPIRPYRVQLLTTLLNNTHMYCTCMSAVNVYNAETAMRVIQLPRSNETDKVPMSDY